MASQAKNELNAVLEAKSALFTLHADKKSVSKESYVSEMVRRRFWHDEAESALTDILADHIAHLTAGGQISLFPSRRM
jgi:hypothetical protein